MSDNENHIAPSEVGAAIDYFNAEFREESATRRHFDVLIEWIIELRARLLSAEQKLVHPDKKPSTVGPLGTYLDTKPCPVCSEDKPGPCWRCHGERRVIK